MELALASEVKGSSDNEMRCAKREQWLVAMLEHMGGVVIAVDREGRVEMINPAGEALLGISQTEALGQDVRGLMGFQGGDPLDEALRGGVRGAATHEVLVTPDARETPVEVRFAPVWAPSGDGGRGPDGLLLIVQDLSDRVKVEERLGQRNLELALLHRTAQQFNSTLDLEQVLATFLEEVRHLLNAAACSVWLLESEGSALVCWQASGLKSHVARGWRLPLGQGLVGWVAERGEALIVADTRVDDRHSMTLDQQADLELRSIMSVPLQVKQRTIGVLQVSDARASRFDATDLALLEPLAASAAVAIENARLYAEADRLRAYNENIVQSMEEGILLQDEQGRIAFINPKAGDLLGYTLEELAGQPLTESMKADHAAEIREQMARQGGKDTLQLETVLLTRQGRPVPVLLSVRPMFDGERFTGTLCVFTDITTRKQAEEALRESEGRFRSLFENAPLCVFEVDLEQMNPTITRANRQAEMVYGWSAAEFVSSPMDRIVPSQAVLDLARMVTTLKTGRTTTVESVNQRRDGSLFPVRISATAEEVSGLSRIIFVIEDITAEKSRRSEEEAIAEERRRIAREIHDGLAQDLASLRFRARLWHRLVDEDPAQMHVELDGLRELLSREIREVRRSIFALRAVALDELGFYPALEQFAQGFGEQNQLHVELRVLGPRQRMPPSLEPVLFRIVQEALNNVGKHARAQAAWVTLDLREAALTLTVRDDGAGFDQAILDDAARVGHLGLKQMRERVAALEGEFAIESHASIGTTIRVVLPWPD